MKLLPVLLFIAFQTSAQLPAIHSGAYHWNEFPVKKEADRESRKVLQGTTPEFSFFSIHITTQQKGAIPHPPHTQKDIEELIIIKEGKLKCTVGDKVTELGAGGVMIIPPLTAQSFENAGDGPVTYYVLQFRSNKPMDIERSEKAGGSLLINPDTLVYTEKDDRGSQKYFNRATAMCENYEMHITKLLKKGPSHAAHRHVDTEIILVIDGEVGMTVDGKEYTGTAGDLLIAESGTLHQVGNAGDKPCSYFAFKWR